MRPLRDRANDFQTIGPTGQRDMRIVHSHLSREPFEIRFRHIGRVRDDRVEVFSGEKR